MRTLMMVEDLIDEALGGGPALRFVNWFLHLRQTRARSYKGMQNLRCDQPIRGTHTGPRWCSTFAKNLWSCFLSLSKEMVHK